MAQDQAHNTEFVKKIKDSLGNGFCFVPLLGNGFSIASGILSNKEIPYYLRYCIAKCLVCKSDIMSMGWPRFTECNNRKSKAYPLFSALNDLQGNRSGCKALIKAMIKIEEAGPIGEHRGHYLEAAASTHDWRSMLQCLSRIRRVGEGKDAGITLGPVDHSVTDSFSIHITRGRTPNLGHKMMAHLSRPMRIRLLLTTNFDTLLEDAFLDVHCPLAVFDVHKSSGLPNAHLVHAQPSIVKLHGGRYGTRADFSLDDEPTDNDKKAFVEYLSGPAHLLVTGCSATDIRIISLIAHALKNREQTQIFWICHSEDGKNRIGRLFRDAGVNEDKIIFTVASAEMLLLNLYQELTHSLPPGGTDLIPNGQIAPNPYNLSKPGMALKDRLMNAFPSDPDISPPFVSDEAAWEADFSSSLSKYHKYMPELTGKDSHPGKVYVIQAASGASSALASLFNSKNRERYCVWLELDDFFSVKDLVESLAKCMGKCWGLNDSEVISLPLSSEMKVSELKDYLEPVARSPFDRKWLVAFYSRGGAGNDAKWKSESWEQKEYGEFWRLLEALSFLGVDVVYLPFDEAHEKSFKKKLAGRSGNGVPIPEVDPYIKDNGQYISGRRLINASYDDMLNKVKAWINSKKGAEREKRLRFLYVMSLFRQSRHPSALCSWAAQKPPFPFGEKDNDDSRAETRDAWLRDLENMNLIRIKPDGYAWMHWDVREGLKKYLLKKHGTVLTPLRAECHQGIADWYLKAFRATNDLNAFYESLYHRWQCIQAAGEAGFPSRASIKGNKGKTKWQTHLVRGALLEMITSIERIKPILIEKAGRDLAESILQNIPEIQTPNTTGDSSELRVLENHFRELCGDVLSRIRLQSGSLQSPAESKNSKEAESNNSKNQTKGKKDFDKSRLEIVERHFTLSELNADWQKAYSKLVECSVRRQFIEADQIAKELLVDHLRFNLAAGDEPQKLRSIAATWLCEKKNASTIRFAVKVLRRFMYAQVLGAVFDNLDNEFPSKQVVSKWKMAEGVYTMVTELLRYAREEPGMFGCIENVRIRSEYALVLAHLKRFSEAHRRLDEAMGYLAIIPGGLDSARLAEVAVRRAEVNLLLAQSEKGSNRFCALVRDCFDSIERAERVLYEHSEAIWWRSKLCIIQLEACLCAQKLPPEAKSKILPYFREKINRYPEILRLGMQLAKGDPLRTLWLSQLGLSLYEHGKDRGMLSPTSLENDLKKLVKDPDVPEPIKAKATKILTAIR